MQFFANLAGCGRRRRRRGGGGGQQSALKRLTHQSRHGNAMIVGFNTTFCFLLGDCCWRESFNRGGEGGRRPRRRGRFVLTSHHTGGDGSKHFRIRIVPFNHRITSSRRRGRSRRSRRSTGVDDVVVVRVGVLIHGKDPDLIEPLAEVLDDPKVST